MNVLKIYSDALGQFCIECAKASAEAMMIVAAVAMFCLMLSAVRKEPKIKPKRR